LPTVSYYEIGTALTANHSHAAMMGVYGMLAVGFMLFCSHYLLPEDRWSDKLAKISFWSLNIGLHGCASSRCCPSASCSSTAPSARATGPPASSLHHQRLTPSWGGCACPVTSCSSAAVWYPCCESATKASATAAVTRMRSMMMMTCCCSQKSPRRVNDPTTSWSEPLDRASRSRLPRRVRPRAGGRRRRSRNARSPLHRSVGIEDARGQPATRRAPCPRRARLAPLRSAVFHIGISGVTPAAALAAQGALLVLIVARVIRLITRHRSLVRSQHHPPARDRSPRRGQEPAVETLTDAMSRLRRDGYRADLSATVDGQLRCGTCGRRSSKATLSGTKELHAEAHRTHRLDVMLDVGRDGLHRACTENHLHR